MTEKASSSFARFTRRFAVALAGLIALSVGAVVAMDPYRLYATPTRAALNAKKPYPEHFQAEIKSTLALRQDAKGLLLGNSRMEIGFDPAAAKFPHEAQPVFNLGIPGTGIENTVALLDRLLARGLRPRAIVLGIELTDFYDDPAARFDAAQPESALDTLRWRFETTFSMTALGDAWQTWRLRNSALEGMTAQGLNPLAAYQKLAKQDGYYTLFRQKAEQTARAYARLSSKHLANGPSTSLTALRHVMDLAARQGIRLELLIHPTHAQALALLEAQGLWEPFETWKRMMAREVEGATAASPETRVRLWDFSGFGGARCETIPPKGDRNSAMRWYWEAAHYRPELGAEVLAMIFEAGHRSPLVDGTLLTVQTLDASFARIAAERQACVAAQPQLFEDVRQIAAKVAAGRT